MAEEEKLEEPLDQDEREKLEYVSNCLSVGFDYRTLFKSAWDECEQQVRCEPPSDWDEKEDWQTKIYIPLQAKTSETAQSLLSKAVFPTRFYHIQGLKDIDRERDDYLMLLYDCLFNEGRFYPENDFVLQETIDLGTGVMKFLVNQDGRGITFTWRSIFNCFFDSTCGHDFDKSRFWIDEYKKDMGDLIAEVRKPGSIYKKEKIQEMLDELTHLAASKTKAETDMIIVKGIDGTTELTIPKEWKEVTLHEFWGKVPVRVQGIKGSKVKGSEKTDESSPYVYEDRVITVVNQRFIIRDDENPYGFIPAQPMRIKPRKYDFYGKGYLENVRGLQDLINSVVNLGFDSLKLCSMDIVFLDKSKVANAASIQYKPKQIWELRDVNNAVKFTRSGIGNSALSEILNGITLVDQIHQDATGVTRHAQGTQPPGPGGKGEETLGEYQLKLQAVGERFTKVGRLIEYEYITPLIKKIFKIIINEKLFKQELVDDILGFKEVQEQDPLTGEMITTQVPKLDLASLGEKELGLSFKATGVTQFIERMTTLQTLKQTLAGALQDPRIGAMTKIDILYERIMQWSDIPNYQDFLKTKEEIQSMMIQQQAQLPPPGMMGPSGMRQPPPMPQAQAPPPVPAMAGAGV